MTEIEQMAAQLAEKDAEISRLSDENRKFQGAAECANAAAKRRWQEIASLRERLEKAERDRSSHPKICPITGREFFMTLEHPERGYVATYGGPFDSYTTPEPDEDGCFRSERYDHDRGEWIEGGEPERFHILTDTEHNELWEAAQRAEKAERDTAQIYELSTGWRCGAEGVHLLRINEIAYAAMSAESPKESAASKDANTSLARVPSGPRAETVEAEDEETR